MPRVLLPLLLLASPALAAKPNVVLIVVDSLGQTDLGCYGSTYHNTPNLDAFAKSGVKITDATAASPVSAPTRAALLTGKHPARLNLTDDLLVTWKGHNPPQAKFKSAKTTDALLEDDTLAAELKKAGYVAGHVGRWDLGRPPGINVFGFDTDTTRPTDFGFDTAVGDLPLWFERREPHYFAPFKVALDVPGQPYRGVVKTVDISLSGLTDVKEGEFLTDCLTTEAEKFIVANKAKPFFLQLSHYAVHAPLAAKKEVIAKYKDGPPGKQGNPTYAAMVQAVDESIGRVLKALDEAKLADSTVVIVTSSCGGEATTSGDKLPPTINTPYRDGKGFLYEGGLRVPFLIRGPGVKTGGIPVTSVDVTPTVLGLCGVKTDLKFDGRDLSTALGGADVKVAAESYLHFPHYSLQGGRPGGAMRSENWKYVEYFDSDRRSCSTCPKT